MWNDCKNITSVDVYGYFMVSLCNCLKPATCELRHLQTDNSTKWKFKSCPILELFGLGPNKIIHGYLSRVSYLLISPKSKDSKMLTSLYLLLLARFATVVEQNASKCALIIRNAGISFLYLSDFVLIFRSLQSTSIHIRLVPSFALC